MQPAGSPAGEETVPSGAPTPEETRYPRLTCVPRPVSGRRRSRVQRASPKRGKTARRVPVLTTGRQCRWDRPRLLFQQQHGRRRGAEPGVGANQQVRVCIIRPIFKGPVQHLNECIDDDEIKFESTPMIKLLTINDCCVVEFYSKSIFLLFFIWKCVVILCNRIAPVVQNLNCLFRIWVDWQII